jgi:hypothetical protein
MANKLGHVMFTKESLRMSRAIKKAAKRQTFEGEVEVCCHRVKFRYFIEGVAKNAEELSDEAKADLEREAEERAKHCIVEGYHSGELCCLLYGGDIRKEEREQEIFGWWEITKD